MSKVNPIESGWAKRVNTRERIKIRKRSITVISENSLDKILTLGVKDKDYLFFSEVLRELPHSWFTRPKFLFKLLKRMITLRNVWCLGSLSIVFCGLWRYISFHKHLLRSLLRLEFIILGVFWLLTIETCRIGREGYFSLFFLTLAACEGAVGLSLLILVVRAHGNDVFSSFRRLEC